MAAERRIVIFVDKPDWHARRLVDGFAARGVAAECLSLKDCGFEIGSPNGLHLPGFEESLPDGCFVRCVPGGSFEQVTLRLSVLHALREAGVPVTNDARAIERCVDKSMTSFLMQRAGLATPPAWVCESLETAAAIVERETADGRPLVLKPLFGSQGRGLNLIEKVADLPPEEELSGVYYLQRYVEAEGGGWRDFRVLVAGTRAVAAMLRHGKNWITNAHQGADCEYLPVDPEQGALAVAAVWAVGAGYAGVDLIRGRDGRYQILEVNSMPAWSALQRVNEVDISQALVDSYLEGLDARDTDLAPVRIASAADG